MMYKELFLGEVLALYKEAPLPGMRQEVKNQMVSFAEYLLTTMVGPKAVGLTYATIKYWESKGYLLLSLPKEADEWRKYSVIELLWFEVLKKVSEMGCTLDKVVPLLIYGYANYKGNNTACNINEPETPVMLIDGNRVNPFMAFLGHVVSIVMAKSKASVNITKNGCQFYFQKFADKTAIANRSYDTVFEGGILLSISDIVFKYVANIQPEQQAALNIFTTQESEVLMLLNNKKLQSITIQFDNGSPNIVERTERFDITRDDDYAAKPLVEFLSSPYQTIKAVTNGGKTIAIETTTKQKLK